MPRIPVDVMLLSPSELLEPEHEQSAKANTIVKISASIFFICFSLIFYIIKIQHL